MPTFTTVLAKHNITVPDQALADIEVPVLTGAQRQGDVLIIPRGPLTPAEQAQAVPVTPAGVAVVRGEATGNTHLLHADPDSTVTWITGPNDETLLLGVLSVQEGEAFLIHTDEHSANGIGPGVYRLHGKQEFADQIRRVQD